MVIHANVAWLMTLIYSALIVHHLLMILNSTKINQIGTMVLSLQCTKVWWDTKTGPCLPTWPVALEDVTIHFPLCPTWLPSLPPSLQCNAILHCAMQRSEERACHQMLSWPAIVRREQGCLGWIFIHGNLWKHVFIIMPVEKRSTCLEN